MKKIINNDNVVLILLLLAMLLAGVANFLVIYSPHDIVIMLDIIVMLLALYALLVSEFKSKWKKVVKRIMLFLTLGASFSSIALITKTTVTENTHNEMVKKEREKESENKRLKQVIDREISKQLDQRKDEINNRK